MKSERLGAVVAAGVMACGWLGTAEAAPIYNVSATVVVDFEGQGIGGSSNPIVGDFGTFVVQGSTRTSDLGDFEIIAKDLDLVGGLDGSLNSIGFSGAASAKNVPVSGDVPGKGDVSALISFGLAPLIFDNGISFIYSGTAPGGFTFSVNGTGFFGNDPGGIQADFLISVVPLPATAPLFGAALVGLAGLTGARRRGRRVTPLA